MVRELRRRGIHTAKTAVPEAEEGEVTSEIPEISTEAMGEPEAEEKLESSEHADIYRMKRAIKWIFLYGNFIQKEYSYMGGEN